MWPKIHCMVKIIDFSFMPKIIRILRSCSMKIFSTFPTVNISKHNFWLLICIAKNFIWTTLKMIFSIFRFFCSLRFQIYKYCPIIINHTSMEILFIQMMYTSQSKEMDPYDWFCGPGSHIYIQFLILSFYTSLPACTDSIPHKLAYKIKVIKIRYSEASHHRCHLLEELWQWTGLRTPPLYPHYPPL